MPGLHSLLGSDPNQHRFVLLFGRIPNCDCPQGGNGNEGLDSASAGPLAQRAEQRSLPRFALFWLHLLGPSFSSVFASVPSYAGKQMIIVISKS